MPSQNDNQTIVLASGVFDLLHLGHVKFLEGAKKTGGKNAKLFVIIARDNTVEKAKGRKPVMPENQRLALVESLRVVDDAALGLEDFDIGNIIETIKPDVVALGYDQLDMEDLVKKYVTKHNLKTKIVRVGKFEADELDSSSKIRKKIVEKYT
jgi:FAD synthetase